MAYALKTRHWCLLPCLSHRYISDRFLPDKAIDLVDEAAAKLRTEINSMPTELDEVSRRVMQLEIEREAFRKETDQASRERLVKLEKELADLKAKRTIDCEAQWERRERRARWTWRNCRKKLSGSSKTDQSEPSGQSKTTISRGRVSCNIKNS